MPARCDAAHKPVNESVLSSVISNSEVQSVVPSRPDVAMTLIDRLFPE